MKCTHAQPRACTLTHKANGHHREKSPTNAAVRGVRTGIPPWQQPGVRPTSSTPARLCQRQLVSSVPLDPLSVSPAAGQHSKRSQRRSVAIPTVTAAFICPAAVRAAPLSIIPGRLRWTARPCVQLKLHSGVCATRRVLEWEMFQIPPQES